MRGSMSSRSFDLRWEELFEDSLPSTQQVVEVFSTDRNFNGELSVDMIFYEIERDAVLFENPTKQPADNAVVSCMGRQNVRWPWIGRWLLAFPQKTQG